MSKVLAFQPEPQLPAVIETPTYRKLRFALSDCHQNGHLAVIRGGVGLGKTFTLEGYAAEHEYSVALLTLDPTTRALTPGMTAAYTAFADLWERTIALDLRRPSNLTYPFMIRGLIEQLAADVRREHGPLLLILDEAQYARPDLLDAFRSMHDRGLFGLVVSGNARMFNARRGRTEAADFSALLSRAQHVLDITAPTAGDVEAVAIAHNIGGTEERALLARCAAAGGLRELFHVMEKARAGADGRALTLKHLKAAAGSTGFSTLDRGR